MSKFSAGQSFADGDQVTGAKLNNITGLLDIYTGLISEQTAMAATVSTADQLLIADVDNGDSGAANRVTVQKLLNDTLTNGTYTNANLTGTITSNRTVATSATITTGTIPTLVSNNATIGTTTGTAGVFTSGTITTGLIPTLTAGTTTGTAGIFTSGTIATLNSTNGTVVTLNSTTGTIAGLNSTNGTVATLNSTTGTIGNLSTTLAGDFTISQGTGTLGVSGVVAGTYGTSNAIPRIVVDSKGRITTLSTSALGNVGKVLQVVETSSTTSFNISTDFPIDNTIPQNTEGGEILSLSITPVSATSTIYIKYDGSSQASGITSPENYGFGLFKDTTVNAIFARGYTYTAVSTPQQNSFSYSEASGSTTARTYKIRAGTDTNGNFRTNVIPGGTGSVFGGSLSSISLQIWEVSS